jgi:hypothetical protein
VLGGGSRVRARAVAGHCRWRFLRGIFIRGGNSLEANVCVNPGLVKLLKIGAAARLLAECLGDFRVQGGGDDIRAGAIDDCAQFGLLL